MLRKIDRLLLRVPNLPSAVHYYTQTLGLKLLRQDARVASLQFPDGSAELVLHVDADLPAEAIYYLVDDVRDLYLRRAELKLNFVSAPVPASHGYRAIIKDPFGNTLQILDRTNPAAGVVEDAKPPSMTLFAGVEVKAPLRRDALVQAYTAIGRTADDLPYTPHFERLYADYVDPMPEPRPTRSEVWRHLLTLRKKKGGLPKMGEARSPAPAITPEAKSLLRAMLGEEIGRRDRLPYTEQFDAMVDAFNKTQPRPLSPHLVWRLVATLAK